MKNPAAYVAAMEEARAMTSKGENPEVAQAKVLSRKFYSDQAKGMKP
jgi:hypothetical protein